MSSEIYSTSPSLFAATFVGVPPWFMSVAGFRFTTSELVLAWIFLCIGILSVFFAIWISWGVGIRGIVLQCPIIAAVGAIIGFLGWERAGNTPLLWANSILFGILVIVALYTVKTKSLH